eukprot:1294260-Amphidinium_carterae.1
MATQPPRQGLRVAAATRPSGGCHMMEKARREHKSPQNKVLRQKNNDGNCLLELPALCFHMFLTASRTNPGGVTANDSEFIRLVKDPRSQSLEAWPIPF